MKKGILLTAVIVLSAGGLVQAQEGELGVTADVTFLSKYIWRGYDMYDDKSAIQASIDLDLYDTGFGLNILASRANSSGFEDAEWWIYTLDYSNSVFEGENCATDYNAGWRYYNFPDMSNEDADMQEFFAELSWPDICPFGVVPSYTAIWMWPAKSNNTANEVLSAVGRGDVTGWLHIFGLGYDLTVSDLLPEIPEQTLHFSVKMVYNDGVLGVDHDWSHILWGVSTSIEYGPGTFTPALYYQTSMEDTVNENEEFWTGLSYTVSF